MTTPPIPPRRDLRQDLIAVALAAGALAAAVVSCVAGGWPVVLTWVALILGATAGAVGMREPTPAPRDPGLADPDDPNAMHVESARGPDTT